MIYKDAYVYSILQRAIDKAVSNGYMRDTHESPINAIQYLSVLYLDDDGSCDPESLIFDHDFAKAIWGVSAMNKDRTDIMRHQAGPLEMAHWQYHLQQMVLEEHPITYLAKFL